MLGTESTSRGFTKARLLVLDETACVEDDIFAGVLPMVRSEVAIWALSTPSGAHKAGFTTCEDADGEPLSSTDVHAALAARVAVTTSLRDH